MNPLKKSVGGLLANPFNSKDKQEDNPLSHIAHDSRRGSKQLGQSSNFATHENYSKVNVPGSYLYKPYSPQASQQNPSRMLANNPLRMNVLTSEEKQRGSRFLQQQSAESVIYTKGNIKPLNFKGENIYENFKHIIYEIERKDAKINNLESEMKNVKLAKDPKEINHFKRQLTEGVKIFHAEEHRYNALNEKNEQMKKEIEALKTEVDKKQPIVQRQQNYFKSNAQLQTELNNTQSELGELRGRYGKIVINDKIKIEQEFKQKMESQLFQIVLDVAKDNNNAEIQKLYAKMKGKKLAVSNLV